MMRHPLWLLAILPLSNALAVAAVVPPHPKYLIEFGWNEPDPAFMRAHVSEMERMPFDGCVFHATVTDAARHRTPFLWNCWGRTTVTRRELQASLDELRAIRFHRFTHNFLRFNTAPGDIGWFDGFSAVLNNAKQAAAFAHDGGCAGVLFDTEQYDTQLFNFSRRKGAPAGSWEDFSRQARLRGRQVMNSFQDGYPGLTVFLTFGYALPFRESRLDPKRLPEARDALLAPFLDGMVEAARDGTRIVDGYESSYSFREIAQFRDAYRLMSEGVTRIVADPERYRHVFQFGFGIWLDDHWRKRGWNDHNPQVNWRTPDSFRSTVQAALRASDEYVWIYTETPKWWTATGRPDRLPDAYVKSLEHSRDRSDADNALSR